MIRNKDYGIAMYYFINYTNTKVIASKYIIATYSK